MTRTVRRAHRKTLVAVGQIHQSVRHIETLLHRFADEPSPYVFAIRDPKRETILHNFADNPGPECSSSLDSAALLEPGDVGTFCEGRR